VASDEFLQQRLIGYARVSTGDQELSLQIDSLVNHGVKRERIDQGLRVAKNAFDCPATDLTPRLCTAIRKSGTIGAFLLFTMVPGTSVIQW
jgi:hypothetical protein